ncbi:hypothetical protein, partial [Roseibium sp.]|uniref:hypothetical protein n=1 Tax=Roseibium sp. TaxID=1936156 RepID=UPI0035169057
NIDAMIGGKCCGREQEGQKQAEANKGHGLIRNELAPEDNSPACGSSCARERWFRITQASHRLALQLFA